MFLFLNNTGETISEIALTQKEITFETYLQ